MNKHIITSLKRKGYFQQQDTGYFYLKIVSKAGNMTTEEMKKVVKIAEKYGNGYISFTTRQCVEVPWIKSEDIEAVSKEVDKMGLTSGSSGKKVTPIISCKGTVCKHGLFDAQGLGNKLHEKYFGKELPAKFKIGIGGCPNDCIKSYLNDLGFIGQKVPKLQEDRCKGCNLCISSCKGNAIEKNEEIIKINYKECLWCGKCINICPFGAIDAEKEGVSIYLSGKYVVKHRIGNHLNNIFTIEDAEVITGRILNYYMKNGKPSERFVDCVERIGVDEIEKEIL